MTESLFRQQAIDAQRVSGLGRISLAQPPRLWLLTLLMLAASGSALLLLALGSYTARSQVQGQLVPQQGMATVVAPTTGAVTRVLVSEGDTVRSGQLLAVVSAPRATLRSGDALLATEAVLEQRRVSLAQAESADLAMQAAERSNLVAQLAMARDELTLLEAATRTEEQQLAVANALLAKHQQLHSQHFISDLQLAQQQAALLEYQSRWQSLQRQKSNAQRQIAQLRSQLSKLPAEEALARVSHDRTQAQLTQETIEANARFEFAIVSPTAGVVATQTSWSGQSVSAGQPLFAILPKGAKLEAQLLLPSRAVGFVAAGDVVHLRYRAFPFEKFGHHTGVVSKVSRSALSTRELGSISASSTPSEPLYRVAVTLAQQDVLAYGKREPLKPGMLLEADILGERRSLLEWALAPVYSVAGRMGPRRTAS